MASGTFKDMTKALNHTFSSSKSLVSLPEELQSIIEAFLDKHAAIEEQDLQKLQEELQSIHAKYVGKDKTRLGGFLHALRLLCPAITGQSRLQHWWSTVVGPVINGVGHKHAEIEHATAFIVGTLDYDADDDKDGEKAKQSSHFLDMLLKSFLSSTHVVSGDAELLSPENEFVAQQLESVLVHFGKRRPKYLLIALDHLVVRKETRMQALGLLCAFLRHQPPHLYTVSQTPLIEHLLKCLMIDTSTTVISLALSTLIMFLPHIPNSVITHLPRLFLIYSRLLCWDRFTATVVEDEKNGMYEEDMAEKNDTDNTNVSETDAIEEPWEKLQSSFENTESTAPELINYFTFLYGLYPLNFTSYVRKPRKYLKSINFPRADEFDLDQEKIRLRTEHFRRLHLMHPNFYQTTVEDELTENRWLKSDPENVVAECIGLRVAGPTGAKDHGHISLNNLPEVPTELVRTEDIPPQSLVARDAELLAVTDHATSVTARNGRDVSRLSGMSGQTESFGTSQRTSIVGRDSVVMDSPVADSIGVEREQPVMDSPTLPYSDLGMQSSEKTISQINLNSPQQAPIKDSTSSVQRFPKSPALRPTTDKTEANVAYLQREVMLLRNDLNFERFLKEQHLSHIGQLQRRHINEATVEAETQNLISTNRALKAKLAKSNESYASLRKETAAGRTQAKKWEADLSARVRTLREDERKWRADEEALRVELSKVQQDCDHLRRLVVESESRELLSQQKVASMELDLEQVETLRNRVQELDDKIRIFEAKELQFEQANDDRDALRTEVEAANLQLQSQASGLARERESFENQIRDLEARLLVAQNPKPEEPGTFAPPIQHIVDAANARYASLQKEHTALKHRHADLELKCQELERDAADAVNQLAATRTHPLNGSNIFGTNYAKDDQAVNFSSFSAASLSPGPTPTVNFGSIPDVIDKPFRRQADSSTTPRLTSSPSMPTIFSSSAPMESILGASTPLASPDLSSATAGVPLYHSLTEGIPHGNPTSAAKVTGDSDVPSAFGADPQEQIDKGTGESSKKSKFYGVTSNMGLGKSKEDDKKRTKGGLKTGGFRGFRNIM